MKRPEFTNCRQCEKEFEKDRKDRVFCSRECYRLHRKISHREYCREWTRDRRGYYKKWIKALEKRGYVVYSPQEAEVLLVG